MSRVDKIEALDVRTFTGAWIETMDEEFVKISETFAPSRVRGLKHR